MLLTDADVAARLDARTAVAAMRDALVAAHEGRLIAPPRASAVLEGGRLVMTAGHLADEWYGFRSYDTFGHADGEQLVVLHDARDGRIRAIAVGEEIGSRRTGRLGGAAVDLLARPDAATVGVIGVGAAGVDAGLGGRGGAAGGRGAGVQPVRGAAGGVRRAGARGAGRRGHGRRQRRGGGARAGSGDRGHHQRAAR